MTFCFVGDTTYRIVLFGKIKDGKQGSYELTIRANKPPEKGTCTVTPTTGSALNPLFNLTCQEFTDENTPLHYEFLYSKSPDEKNQSLGSGVEHSLRNVAFPSGSITLYAKVSDSVGATTIVKFKTPVKVSLTY